jgi:hypothetical protein
MRVRCRDVSAMATDFMEGTLSWRQRQAIWLHLALCRGCRAFMQQMRLPAIVSDRVALVPSAHAHPSGVPRSTICPTYRLAT